MCTPIVRALAFTALFSFVFAGQEAAKPSPTLSPYEREYAMSQLHATRKLFLDSVAGLSAEQLRFKAAPDRWSIAECAEHIAVSEDFLSALVKEQVLKNAATPEKRAEMKVKYEQLAVVVADRSVKFQAPEPIAPKDRFPSPEAAVQHFKESRDRDIRYIETTEDPLHDHFMNHPAAGPLDGYGWILLMSGHTERHTKQILEVKADPKYPK